MAEKRVIDLSKWNDVTDYSKLVKGIDGVILRIGYRSSTYNGKIIEDAKFATHYNALKKLNCPIGVYFFTEAINLTEAKEEADWTIATLKKYNVQLSFPIAVDTEWCNNTHTGRSDRLSNAVRTNCVVIFLENIMAAGYQAMIYASDSWFKSNLNYEGVKPYNKWVARYSSNRPTITDKVMGWQKTQSHVISGLKNTFDLSEWYAPINHTTSKYSGVPKPTETKAEENIIGQALVLKNEPLYASSSGPKVTRTLTGEYYVWSPKAANGRIRITSKPEYAGVVGKVTGWIEQH